MRAGVQSHLAQVMSRYRSGILAVALFSGLINILMLTGSLFMLAVYDKVLPARSIPSLIALGLFAALLYVFHGFLEALRGHILSRIGAGLDEGLGRRLFTQMIGLANSGNTRVDPLGPLRDVETLRSFSASPGPGALFDLPWIPLYLALCFAFHPLIGYTATAGAVLLVALTIITDFRTRGASRRSHETREMRNGIAEECRRNAEVLQAMAITPALAQRWGGLHDRYLAQQQALSDGSTVLGTISKVTRLMLQSLVLAVGAYLVINLEATGGIMIAGSIVMSRALAPIDLAVAHWRAFISARQAWERLDAITREREAGERAFELPPPTKSVEAERISIVPPNSNMVAAHDVSLALQRGDALGIIGASGAGKSSVARALAGVWSPVRGAIRFDGLKMDQWRSEALGPHIGYLPQGVELIAGTVAENIARFQDAGSDEILQAARNANVHDLIAGLPDGYETQVGLGGRNLSAGQRQRVALARAMFRDPFLIVLDEPNSNLDSAGEAALADSILRARQRGSIVVVVAHRPSIMSAVNKVLFMGAAGQNVFGERDIVLQRVLAKGGDGGSDAALPQRGEQPRLAG
jgi:PrtD family type I secretion system ABC transporter